MTGVRVSDHLHVRNAASEGPAERSEKGEVRNPWQPIFATETKDARHCGERPWNHRSGLVPEVSSNAPADREGKSRREKKNLQCKSVVCRFSQSRSVAIVATGTPGSVVS